MPEQLQPTVLIIDDDPVFVRWVSAVLGSAGYITRSLPALPAGTLPPESRDVDAIILDLVLPGRDGFELLDDFRADPAVRDIPVLMLTAHDPVAYRLKGLALGADDYLVKPPNKHELLLRIGALLRRSGNGGGDRMRMTVRAADRSRILLDLRDAAYVHASNNFCYVHVGDRRYFTAEAIGELAERLVPVFLRVHRSYLVNTARVVGARRPTRSTLALEMDTPDGVLVPVGPGYREDVREALGL